MYLPIACVLLLAVAAAWERAKSGLRTGDDSNHRLRSFSPVFVIILSILTLGLFHVIYYAVAHGRLPRNRVDDPTTGWAIGLSFIPVFNMIYWLPFLFFRLAHRINEQLVVRGQQATSADKCFVAAFAIGTFAFAPLVSALTGISMGALPYLLYLAEWVQGISLLLGVAGMQVAINSVVRASATPNEATADQVADGARLERDIDIQIALPQAPVTHGRPQFAAS